MVGVVFICCKRYIYIYTPDFINNYYLYSGVNTMTLNQHETTPVVGKSRDRYCWMRRS